MDEQIIIKTGPVDVSSVWIFSNQFERIPTTQVFSNQNELLSFVAMSAAKYGIRTIKICGPHSYTEGVVTELTKKINVCFDKKECENFSISLI